MLEYIDPSLHLLPSCDISLFLTEHCIIYPYDCYTEQDALTFCDEEIKKFRTRLENGYDLQLDPRYNLWLSSQAAANGQNTDNSIKNNDNRTLSHLMCRCYNINILNLNHRRETQPCIAGSCSHPKSRNWVACEKCTEWHHCICAGISRATAIKNNYHYICHFCCH